MNCAPALLRLVLARHALPATGIHGVAHWARVLENGRRLSPLTGAVPIVVEYFALLHDACRLNDGHDRDHGPRAALLAESLRGTLIHLPDEQFNLLHLAIERHARGATDGDPTVCTCWDADRLDLYRVGIHPAPRRLCTEAARDPAAIAWATDRAARLVVPDLMREEWGFEQQARGPADRRLSK